ncbi:DUF3397 family protein [Holzapfeliella floricola]|uniref:DUF3397 family protein n=1 Tax=Holzapfeliella floricola TaxID=679249 RepID=UPI000704C027|nr:DUF3397 family protein [Holzapfeliella floricola]
MYFLIILIGLIISYFVSQPLFKKKSYFSGYDVFSVFAWVAVLNLSLTDGLSHFIPIVLIILASAISVYAVYTAILNRNIYMKVFLMKFCKFQSFLSIVCLLLLSLLTIVNNFF